MTGDSPYKDVAPTLRQQGGTLKMLLVVLPLIIVLALLLQVLFRYEYLSSGANIVRIDRLTSSACIVALRSSTNNSALGALMRPDATC